MGIGKAVQPIFAPMFAPEPAITEYHPTGGDGEKIQQEPALFGTESGITASTKKQVTTSSADLTTRPLEERGFSRSPSKPPVAITGAVAKAAELSEQKHTGYSPKSDSPKPEPEITVKKQSDGPAASKSRVSIPDENKENVYSLRTDTDAMSSPEIARSNAPEQPASSIKSPTKNDNDVFAFVSHFIQRNAQQSCADLLMEEPKILHDIAENGKQARETAVIERTVSTVSSSAGFRPKTVIHREQPVSRLDEDSVSTPDGMPAPPTVHVTIGRIEVRATPAPLQSLTKTKPSANAMSLDEYLGRRNGGGR